MPSSTVRLCSSAGTSCGGRTRHLVSTNWYLLLLKCPELVATFHLVFHVIRQRPPKCRTEWSAVRSSNGSSSQWQPASIISRSTERGREASETENAREDGRMRRGMCGAITSWSWSHLETNFSGHTTLAPVSIVATIIVINSFMCSVLIQLTKFAQDAPVEAGKKESEDWK